MEYAIISLKNNQHLVKPGEKITTLGELGEPGTTYTDCKTLLYKDATLHIGTPETDNVVSLKIVEISKTDKVDIYKYKSKSRYRRHTGHRQAMTILEVITSDSKTSKAAPKAAKAPKKETKAASKPVKSVKKATATTPKKAAVKK
jgi:large subunit ribosomal protein L21